MVAPGDPWKAARDTKRETFKSMSRKDRTRRSKIPMPIRSADGSSVQLHGGDSGTSRDQKDMKDMVETTSPPSRPVSRPKAPPLNFSSPRSEPAKPSET